MYGLSIFDNFLSQAVIPKLYFEAVSQEQRLQFLAKYCQALENGKMGIDDTYTRAQMDARYMRLEDSMAWQGYFLGNICETLPRDAVASYDYYSSATDSGSKITIKVVAKA